MQVIALLKNLGLAGGFFFLAINGPKDWVIQSKKIREIIKKNPDKPGFF